MLYFVSTVMQQPVAGTSTWCHNFMHEVPCGSLGLLFTTTGDAESANTQVDAHVYSISSRQLAKHFIAITPLSACTGGAAGTIALCAYAKVQLVLYSCVPVQEVHPAPSPT